MYTVLSIVVINVCGKFEQCVYPGKNAAVGGTCDHLATHGNYNFYSYFTAGHEVHRHGHQCTDQSKLSLGYLGFRFSRSTVIPIYSQLTRCYALRPWVLSELVCVVDRDMKCCNPMQ